MPLRPVLLLALLLAACSPSTGASAVTTAPSTTASAAPAADGNFVPTKLTVSVDGTLFDIAQKGYMANAQKTSVGYSLGTSKGEKAGDRTVQWPTINVISGGKDIASPDFKQTDATLIVIGLNWVRNLTARTYTADAAGKTTLTAAGGKLNVTYSGKMNRATGSGDFPETIQVELAAEGLPTSI